MNLFDSGIRDVEAIATRAAAEAAQVTAIGEKRDATPTSVLIAAQPTIMARHKYFSIHQTEIANAMTTISAQLFSTDWIMYALAAIAVIVTVLLFFIVRHRIR